LGEMVLGGGMGCDRGGCGGISLGGCIISFRSRRTEVREGSKGGGQGRAGGTRWGLGGGGDGG